MHDLIWKALEKYFNTDVKKKKKKKDRTRKDLNVLQQQPRQENYTN